MNPYLKQLIRKILHRMGFDIVRLIPPTRLSPEPDQVDLFSQDKSLAKLRELFPYPSLNPTIKPIMKEEDGGGRELITELIVKRDVKLMLEIGSFLGGSAVLWLKTSPDLVLICVDAWSDNWAGDYVAEYGYTEFKEQLNSPDGFFHTFLTNLSGDAQRIVPVRGKSPDILLKLFLSGIQPDLIYIDADKAFDSLLVSHQLWPSAILTGDDWGWQGPDGNYPAQEAVKKLCALKGLDVIFKWQTWILIDRE